MQSYFAEGLEEMKKQTTVFTIGAFLIKPVQRILKYPLLLNQLCEVILDHCITQLYHSILYGLSYCCSCHFCYPYLIALVKIEMQTHLDQQCTIFAKSQFSILSQGKLSTFSSLFKMSHFGTFVQELSILIMQLYAMPSK